MTFNEYRVGTYMLVPGDFIVQIDALNERIIAVLYSSVNLACLWSGCFAILSAVQQVEDIFRIIYSCFCDAMYS